jgi:hypothetical protein
MAHETSAESPLALANPFTGADIAAILRERGWIASTPSVEAGAPSFSAHRPLITTR